MDKYRGENSGSKVDHGTEEANERYAADLAEQRKRTQEEDQELDNKPIPEEELARRFKALREKIQKPSDKNQKKKTA